MDTQPKEDIDVVLGRFQAWVGSRSRSQPAAGVRELTHEEALESRRNRLREPERSLLHKAPRNELNKARVVEDVPQATKTKARPESKVRKESGPRREASAKSATRSHSHRLSRSSNSIASAAVRLSATEAADHEPRRPVFRDALARAIQPCDLEAAPSLAEPARQVAISIRLAPSERALLRARAAEAGITVSAYVRQCALEVEQLRAQVKHVLATMERRASEPEKAPEQFSAPTPGFLTRLMRRLLPTSGPRLALRA